jgi:hypothetical protein
LKALSIKIALLAAESFDYFSSKASIMLDEFYEDLLEIGF